MANQEKTLTVEDDQIIMGGGKRGGGIFGWLVAILIGAGAGYFYFGVHRPLEAAADKKVGDAEKRALDARKAADEAKVDLEKAQAELKEARDSLAKTSAKNAEDDKLLDQLKKEVGSGGAEIAGSGGQITVTMVDKILFQSGEADLSPQGEKILQALGKVLKHNDKLIEVSGHADNQPVKSELKQVYPSNWELSTTRATNVVRFLQDDVGIRARRLKASGYGDSRPLASNGTPTGRAKNRRIEILLAPNKLKVVKGEFTEEVAAAHSAAASAPRVKDKDRAKAMVALRGAKGRSKKKK